MEGSGGLTSLLDYYINSLFFPLYVFKGKLITFPLLILQYRADKVEGTTFTPFYPLFTSAASYHVLLCLLA